MENSNYNSPYFPLSESTSPIQQNSITSSKSYFPLLSKSVVVIVFLIVLTLFPSQAPESMKLNPLTKFWELLYLLFVGILVSYGLFSRRHVKMGNENCSNMNNSLSHMSNWEIFEDGLENSCGSYELVAVVLNGSSVLDKQSEPGSLISESGFGISSWFNEKRSQTWSYKNLQGGSSVFDELGNPGPRIANKPLGLPVRSLLRSRISEPDTRQSMNGGSGSSSGLKGSDNNKINRKFGDLGPLNLEEKFNETVVLHSPIPWGSRSGRMMKMKEQVPIDSHTSDFGMKKDSCGSKATLIRPNSQQYSPGSASKMDVRRREEDLSSGKKSGLSNLKVGTFDKVPLRRGKSVRTIRWGGEQFAKPRNGNDDKAGKKFNQVEATSKEKSQTKTEWLNNLSVDSNNQRLYNGCPMPNQAFFQASSDEEDDAGPGSSEVDNKKAGNFIAKFREQIGLQKTRSINGSKRLGRNYLWKN